MNKYQILRNIKSLSLPEKYSPFPNIDEKNGEQKSWFETILVLYLIILHEFYPEFFHGFLDFDIKKKNYIEGFKKSDWVKDMPNTVSSLNSYVLVNQSSTPLGQVSPNENSHINGFYFCLSPCFVEQLSLSSIHNKTDIQQMIVKENKIEFLFYKLLLSNDIINLIKFNSSTSSLKSIKKLIKSAL